MKRIPCSVAGFSLVELLIAMAIGLFLVGAATAVFVAQSAMSKTTVSQAQIQNAENALAALVTPVIRGAGFTGCSNLGEVVASLTPGGPSLLNAVAGASAPVAMIAGYDASGTGGSGAVTISQTNAANASGGSNWLPLLDTTLLGRAQAGSDVLMVLGATAGFNPVAVTADSTTSSATLSVHKTNGLVNNQYAAVTDCAKTAIFQVTSVLTSTSSVSHATGSAPLSNSSDYLPVTFGTASQLVGLQLTAFYVAQGNGDQSNLMRATYQNGGWTDVPLVPGIDNLQILYGIGDGTSITNYLSANAITDWTKVNAIRLGFLIQGEKGTGATKSYSVLGTSITVPNDGRLRHVYEMTVNLRNAS